MSLPAPVGPRTGSIRDRHGRGMRGPGVAPGPLSADLSYRARSRRDRFDAAVLVVLSALEALLDSRAGGELSGRLGLVEFAVEETPLVPDDWDAATVPLGSSVPATARTSARVVLFRRPIELRTETEADLTALIYHVLVEQVADLLGLQPEDIDPRGNGRQ